MGGSSSAPQVYTMAKKKLTPLQAAEIRRLQASGESVPVLAGMFGVTRGAIYHILNNPNSHRVIDRQGMNNPNAGLTTDSVFVIRFLHKNCGVSGAELARMFNVTRACIRLVLIGATWRRVPTTVEPLEPHVYDSKG